MLNNRLLHRTARQSSRGGFTLVELLVVIAIIAILAGVALGPITAGIKKAQQSGGVQSSRGLALAEFQYANDNNQCFPDKSTTGSLDAGDATDVAAALIVGGYISDPSIFVISGSIEKKYTGAMTGTPTIATTNISWDFVGSTTFTGLTANTPDSVPVVMSCSPVTTTQLQTASATAVLVDLTPATFPYGNTGMVVCLKSNSAQFLNAPVAGAATNPLKVTLFTSYQGYSLASKLAGGG
jgi:prepilin-type N-terminal cleavage/methylation domain-containing protein